jgi:hypothetical protein
MSFRAPGFDRAHKLAAEVEPGVYEVEIPTIKRGAYYLYVAVPELGLNFKDLHYVTLIGHPKATGG